MQLFSGLLGKKLSPAWECRVQGVLWRLFPSAEGILVGEDRDLEKKKVSFFCLDDRTGVVRWKDRAFPEPWWIGMEALHGGMLILHEYAAPDMPDHKKIYALDTASGRTVWSNDDVKFLFAHGEFLYAAKETFEERLFSEYRLADGEFIRQVDPAEIRTIQRGMETGSREVVEFPAVMRAGAAGDADIHAALQSARINPLDANAQIETLSAEKHLVAACCVPEEAPEGERRYVQRLLVFDRARRRVVFDDVMNQQLSMPVPDMFFARAGMLYYIREKHTLRALNLGSSGKHE